MTNFTQHTRERLDEVREDKFSDYSHKLSDETVVYLLCDEYQD